MHWIWKIIVAILGNMLGFWLAATYIPGFNLAGGWTDLAKMALVFAALNFVFKPILRLALGPIIIITLGLGLVIVNAIILYGLTFIFKNLTIEGIPALIYSTILIGFINFIFHFFT